MYNFLVNIEQIVALVNSRVKTKENQIILSRRIHAAQVEIESMKKFRNIKDNTNLRKHLDPIIDHMQNLLIEAKQGRFLKP